MKFAASSKIFWDYSLEKTLQMVKQIGLDGLEINCRPPHFQMEWTEKEYCKIASIAQELELEIPLLSGYMGAKRGNDSEQKEFDHILEAAVHLNSTYIRVQVGGPNAFLASDEDYHETARWVNQCAYKAKLVNKKIVIEMSNGTLVESADDALKLLSYLSMDNVGFVHDAGNMFISWVDYGAESIKKLGDRLYYVHAKGEKRTDKLGEPGSFASETIRGTEYFVQSMLESGEVDHNLVFQALVDQKYKGWITLECHAPFPPFKRVQQDYDYVKNLLSKLDKVSAEE
ncbi:sugar phosphate isomerase/epimerase [Fictibacillus halophilus]|uniref:Sugar phosphate isomerase/epimerase n=1 Tax=Fictibacillus halophilus TaxID=1610490 RepID=A0ABV2LH58_9BACL|nr:sugar phosphate isomerase/epimerase [Fictibacillus halophilus]